MNVTEEGCWNEYLQDADINHTMGRIVGRSLRGLHEFMGKSQMRYKLGQKAQRR